MGPANYESKRRRRRILRRFERNLLWLGFGRWRLPDFMVIGAQKAGTTWLHQNLSHHPEVFVPGRKELHYFNSDLTRTMFGYARYFTDAQDRVVGETTPAYSILRDVDVAFVKKILPHLKIILLIRDPIERAWSQAVMEVATRTKRDINEVADDEFLSFLRTPQSLRRGDYPTMLDTWERHFDKEAISVSFFDEIKSNPERVLNGIFAHLGVSEITDWGPFPVRKIVAPIVEQEAIRLARKGGKFAVEESTPDHVATSKKAMPAAVRLLLEELCADVNANLKQRFGDELPSW